jgi:hypothetical protein
MPHCLRARPPWADLLHAILRKQAAPTTLPREETKTRGEVVNDIFALLETLSAMSWALSNALAHEGLPVRATEPDASYMGFSAFRLALLSLEQQGTKVVDSREDPTSWAFTRQPLPQLPRAAVVSS